MADKGVGMEITISNPENLPKVNNLSHQQTKSTQEITSTSANLPVDRDFLERLKTSLEGELNNLLQTENLGKEIFS